MIKLKNTKNKVVVKDAACLNCGHPFNGQEKFCPDCGQANKGNKITFKSFVHEVFNGLFSFEAKFWNTIVPLLVNPGKVSRDYIDGKRQRYSNPFRFYLTVSILFFLIIGFTKTKEKYQNLAKESKADISDIIRKDSILSTNKEEKEIQLTQEKIDSIVQKLDKEMQQSFIPIPESTRKEVLEDVAKKAKDTSEVNDDDNNKVTFNFGGETRLDDFANFAKKYPDANIDVALDSLDYEKNFTNRFLFTKAKSLFEISKNEESTDQFFSQVLSYGSVALFIFLPFFTLFLKFFYIRRKYTYIDHLIFVFHIQTVFFMLFSIFLLLRISSLNPEIWVFAVLFLLYLSIAMKKFYQQGYLKTILKFLLLNLSYALVSSIGITLLLIISFVLF
ncbi:DUF3667 domain-containing protein [Polaribacter sp. IC066]|nr:DUF3667 domain-containing protein [Polaribacter sp. IC063]TXD57086.1 DUF3667 domain-containing protein [Polaribacter sp. IC066]